MAFIAPIVAAIAGAATGLAGVAVAAAPALTGLAGLASAAAGLKKQKAPSPPPVAAAPPAPKVEDAAAKAQADLDKRRRTLLSTGGQTQYTGPGGAPILSGQTSSPTLLGG